MKTSKKASLISKNGGKFILIKIFTLLLIVLILSQCSKNSLIKDTGIPKTLSTNSPDLQARLEAIKKSFYQQKLEEKIKHKKSDRLSWYPDWENPKIQVVNDSVSYVFYAFLGKVDGRNVNVTQTNGKLFLMVKNEKDFYKAFYYTNGADQKEKEVEEFKMDAFTGNLLLSSLQNGRNYLLDYTNGHLSDSYLKKGVLAAKKMQATKGAISYWEQNCQLVIRRCTYSTLSVPPCSGGSVMVTYSEECHWPQAMCGYPYSLTDYDEQTICEEVWYPDPPTDPGDGGGGGSDGGDRELNTDAIREKFPCADKNILQPIFGSESMSAFVAPFLTDQKPTLTYNTASLPWGSTTTGGKFELGHAIYDPASRTGLSSIVTLNEKMLENSSPLFAAVTTVHETIHGYINYNISLASLNVANDYSDYGNWMAALNGFYLIKDLPVNYSQHTVMLTDYFDKAVEVVTAWDQKQTIHHSLKEIAMAMMYGLNTVDPNTPQNLVDNINEAFDLIKIKYEVTDAELDTFYKSQLNSLIKIPTDCN